MSIQSLLDNFLIQANYDNIHHLHDAQTLADQSRNQIISGKDLVKRNVEHEARQLRMHNQHLVNLATEHIWNLLTSPHKNRFERLANDANDINNYRMLRFSP